MFTHLHVHTEYSLLDGLCRIPQVIAKAKELGMTSLAITDHGSMHGIIDFYTAAKEAGVKPIIGCETYVAETNRQGRSASDKNLYHLTLLAKNHQGYKNLIKLITKAHLEGFYYKPRVDKELLAEHHEGLIALSACAHGELPRLILAGRLEEATTQAIWYKETFNDYYLEIQRHPIPELEKINEVLLSLSSKLNIPIVATNDVHYVNKEDAPIQELLLCIQTNTSIYDEKRLKMAGDFFYLKSPEEMAELFSDLPQALENTQSIADMCQLKLEFGRLNLPQVNLPQGKTSDEYLAEMCWQGLKQRYPSPTPELEQRLAYELEVIKQTQFADYFLVVWDLISFAKKQNIFFGVRGSAAASLALNCLGITNIDPLAHTLVFERFLNIERLEPPDIDLDFPEDRRDEVIAYVTQKYGPDHVAQIITFGTLGARAALRDVGRALGMPYSQVDRVARLITPRPNITLDQALAENKELYDIYHEDSAVQNLVDTAKKLEGVARHASTHAAGVVISREPLQQHIPLQRATKDHEQAATMTQLSMESVARLGLLKLDFLGLANLTTFNDIAAMVALYRPGPMEHIPTFIKAKHGIESIRYPHPDVKKILEETYGVIVYQDQGLHIVQALAGYSLGQADIFRKAMGKKIPEVMKKERQNFINGAKKNGVSAEIAAEIFALIEPFAGYAFNKAHSVSYALIAYETAYLKANYPVEYMTAFLNTYAAHPDRLTPAVAECRRLGISVLPPDVNKSQASFAIEEENGKAAIRFSLTAIKNVGYAAIEPIILAREKGGPFKSIEDFCRRVDLRSINKKVVESLIKAGAFDCLAPRGTLIQAIDRIVSLAQWEQRLRESGQSSMFDLWGDTVPAPLPNLNLNHLDIPLKDKLDWERELLGVYFSEHPLTSLAPKLVNTTTTLCGGIDAEMVGEKEMIAGMVTSMRQLYTRDRRPFVIATLEDLDGNIEVAAWSEVYNQTKEICKEGKLLLVEGTVKLRDDRVSVNCYRVRQYQPDSEEGQEAKPATQPSLPRKITINIAQTDKTEEDVTRLNQVMDILTRYPGQDTVLLTIVTGEETVNMKLPNTINYCPELAREVDSILGDNGLRLKDGTKT